MDILARMVGEVDTALDTLAIRVTYLALAGKELVSVLFSKMPLILMPGSKRSRISN
jgi:hypothetical protein